MNRLLVVFLLLFFTTKLQADIIVFQLKPNASTVAAAQRAAMVRGEKVISYPNAEFPEITADNLKTILERHERQGTDVSSIVFSGHDGSGNFFGDWGDIYPEDVRDAVKNCPRISKNVHSLVLRGCYSATKGQVMESSTWREAFPNLNYIFGFDGAAPSSERPHSKNFVEGVLKLEHQYNNLNSAKQLRSLMLGIQLFNQTGGAAWHQASCGDEYYYSNYHPTANGEVLASGSEVRACNSEQTQSRRNTYYALIDKYLAGSKAGYKLPPTAHQGTELRAAYSFIQSHQHCVRLNAWQSASKYAPERVLNLIYFDYIRDNFMANQDFSSFLDGVATVKNQSSLTVRQPSDFKTASRKEWADFQSDVNRIITSNYGTHLRQSNPQLYNKIYNTNRLIKNAIVELDNRIIPNEWIDSHHSTVRIQ